MHRSVVNFVVPTLLALMGSQTALAAEPIDALEIETLDKLGPHSVWASDLLLRHSLLFDADTGKMLGTLDASGSITKPPLYSKTRDEFYVVEAAYEWGHRGERTDFVTLYDGKTLDAKGEIVIPMQAAESAASIAYTEILDGERILAVFNQFPATSVSLIDLEKRSYLNTIQSAGCAGIYPTGARSFAMLCGNGTLRELHTDEHGQLISEATTEVFFDAVEDPVTMRGVRLGKRWIFTSFMGRVFDVDFGQDPPHANSWSMVADSEQEENWRPGGRQLTALHRDSGRLYVLFHQGGSGTHKDAGRHVWVFDVATQQRVDTFEVPKLAAAGLVSLLQIDSGFLESLLGFVIPGIGGDTIAVTQDGAPILLIRNSGLPVMAVVDARNGEHLRNISEIGLTGNRLVVP